MTPSAELTEKEITELFDDTNTAPSIESSTSTTQKGHTPEEPKGNRQYRRSMKKKFKIRATKKLKKVRKKHFMGNVDVTDAVKLGANLPHFYKYKMYERLVMAEIMRKGINKDDATEKETFTVEEALALAKPIK